MTPTVTTRARDYRVDLVRGLALLIILADHVRNAWVHYVTPQSWQICDFAEVFVFISGFSASLADTVVERRGFYAIAGKALRRVWRLYRWYAASVAAILVTFYLAHRAGLTIPDAYFVELQRKPLQYTVGAFLLQSIPMVLVVIALYLVLTLLLPLIGWLHRRSVLLLVAVSIAVYLQSELHRRGLTPLLLPLGLLEPENGSFNPAAWQLLFVAGYVMPDIRWPQWIEKRRFIWLGAAIILLCGVLRIESLYYQSDYMREAGKEPLAEWRLINFGGWLLLIRPIWSRVPRIPFLMTCGRNALPLFCVGAWLSICCTLLIESTVPGAYRIHGAITGHQSVAVLSSYIASWRQAATALAQFAIVLCGVIALVLLARVLDRMRSKARAAALVQVAAGYAIALGEK